MGFVSSLPPLPLAPTPLLVLLLLLLLLSSSWSLSSIFVHANVCVIAHHFVVAFLLLFSLFRSFLSIHNFAVVICMIIIVIITTNTIGSAQTEWRWSVHLAVCGIFHFSVVKRQWCWHHTLHTDRQNFTLFAFTVFIAGFFSQPMGIARVIFVIFFYRFVSLLVFVLYYFVVVFVLSSVVLCVIRIYVSTCAASLVFSALTKSVPTMCALCAVSCCLPLSSSSLSAVASDCVDVRLSLTQFQFLIIARCLCVHTTQWIAVSFIFHICLFIHLYCVCLGCWLSTVGAHVIVVFDASRSFFNFDSNFVRVRFFIGTDVLVLSSPYVVRLWVGLLRKLREEQNVNNNHSLFPSLSLPLTHCPFCRVSLNATPLIVVICGQSYAT